MLNHAVMHAQAYRLFTCANQLEQKRQRLCMHAQACGSQGSGVRYLRKIGRPTRSIQFHNMARESPCSQHHRKMVASNSLDTVLHFRDHQLLGSGIVAYFMFPLTPNSLSLTPTITTRSDTSQDRVNRKYSSQSYFKL